MKGCPLSCVWCHNPEGISPEKEKLYSSQKCIGCKLCVEECPNNAVQLTQQGIITDRSKCTVCGKCADVCPTKATEISGKEYSDEGLMEQIIKEIPFMDESGGGVTFCGGEPLLHHKELTELLKKCGDKGIHRAVDTTLFSSSAVVKEVMDNCDLFLVDLKHMDSDKHKKYCGVPNEPILSNLKMIADAGKDFWIRIPLIEGVNADSKNIEESAKFLSSLQWQYKTVNLLPYHDIGKNKHLKKGSVYNLQNYNFSKPTDERTNECIDIFNQYGIEASVGG